MKSILSTKKLNSKQRNHLLEQGYIAVDYNAIDIEFLDFKMPTKIQNAIFTSQNGVRSMMNSELIIQNCFCVGQKTKTLLEEKGLKVIKMAKNSSELGEFIGKNDKNEVFHYICGEQRRDELPSVLENSKISFLELKTYKTVLKPKKFDQKWDGILFFSPSSVASYYTLNKSDRFEPTLFCIGETTAEAARNYSTKIEVAEETSVESVIENALKKFKNK